MIVIHLDGGLVQAVYADGSAGALQKMQVVVMDTDVADADDDDPKVDTLPDGSRAAFHGEEVLPIRRLEPTVVAHCRQLTEDS